MTTSTPTAFRFKMLGSLEVIREDPGLDDPQPVPVRGSRQRAVLACLLINAGHPVRPDVLIEAGWGSEGLPEDPRAALHTVISRLRSTLDGLSLTSGPPGYALRVAPEAVDAVRFEALYAAARVASAPRAVELLAEAMALWRGPAYAEHADREFAAAEAARLERLRLDAVEEYAAATIETGDPEAAAAELEMLLTENPYREHAVELLMTALCRAGRPVDALSRFRAHRDRLAEELGLDPLPALCDLEEAILGQKGPTPPAATGSEVPEWLDRSTSFVGRDADLAELRTAVSENRVVTVCGAGGVGKSRLVAQALPELVAGLALPARVVELAPVRPGQVLTAVADAVGAKVRAPSAGEDLIEYLSVTALLLVFDNCEHLRAEVAGLIEQLGRRCPRSRIVATSRHRLGLPSERVVELKPLPLPGREGVGAAAIELFLDRTRRLRSEFNPTPVEVATVAEICRRLDGLPLALELAAARAATLGPDEVLASLAPSGPGVTVLTGLAEVVRWSTQLLTTEQRRLLGHLTAFVGSFDASAAVGLGGRLPEWSGPDGSDMLIAGLQELVESHLVTAEARNGRMAYRMLALVRSFVEVHLAEPTGSDRVRLAHADWLQSVVTRAADDWISGRGHAAGQDLERWGPDIAAALRWLVQEGRLDLAAAITGKLQLCLHWLPSQDLGDLVVEVGERCAEVDDRRLAPGVAGAAIAVTLRGDTDRALLLANRAIDDASSIETHFLGWVARSVSAFYAGDHDEALACIQHIDHLPGLPVGHRTDLWTTAALVECYRGNPVGAREWASSALAGSRAAGAAAAHAFALYASGEIEAREDRERGADLFRAAAAEADLIGATQVGHVARLALLAVLVRLGRWEAVEIAEPLLRDVHRVGSWPQLWTALRITAELLLRRDRVEDAALVLSAVDAAPGAPPLIGEDEQRYATLRHDFRTRLGDRVVERIADLAAGLPRAQVVARTVTVVHRLAGQATATGDTDLRCGGDRRGSSAAPR